MTLGDNTRRTLYLSEEVWRAVKIRAAMEGRSPSHVVADILMVALGAKPEPKARKPVAPAGVVDPDPADLFGETSEPDGVTWQT